LIDLGVLEIDESFIVYMTQLQECYFKTRKVWCDLLITQC